MKRWMLGLLLLLNGAICMAQNKSEAEVNAFLNLFNDFCTEIETTKSPTNEQVDTWKANYKDFKYKYSHEYKKSMNSTQLKTYFKCVGRYNKFADKRHLKDAGAFIDSTAQKGARAVKRGASKASGAVSGYVSKKK